jgi:hypothetical protein
VIRILRCAPLCGALLAVSAHPSFPPPGPPGAGPSPARTPPVPSGTAFYVSPTGAGATCTRAEPCRQISSALALVHPGDVVFVADGAYSSFSIDGVRAPSTAPITIYAQGTGAMVSPGRRDSIEVTNSFYVVIDGLNASGAPRAGASVLCSNHITIKNGRFIGNKRWGIFSGFSDDLVLDHNEAAGSQREHGIYASNSADRPVIRGNLVHDNAASGIQINADGDEKPETDCAWYQAGGVADGVTTGAVLEGNVIYANGVRGGGAINLDGVQGSVVRNNVLYGNHATGIVNYKGDGNAGPKGMEILSNTLVQATGARQGLQLLETAGPNLVRDNILYHPDANKAGLELGAPSDVPNVDSDHNVLDRFILDSNDTVVPLSALQATYGLDRGSVAGAPPGSLFRSAAGGDYALAPASPAIAKGVFHPDAPTDQAGKPRPPTAPDIGALQH